MKPANDLPEPTPQPGWVFRWIRTSYMNNPDHKNVSVNKREMGSMLRERPP